MDGIESDFKRICFVLNSGFKCEKNEFSDWPQCQLSHILVKIPEIFVLTRFIYRPRDGARKKTLKQSGKIPDELYKLITNSY